MTRLQSTRWNSLLQRLVQPLERWLTGSWRDRSIGVLALLLGAYLGSNVASIFVNLAKLQSLGALLMLLGTEALVRLRGRLAGERPGLIWVVLDNLRIGSVFAVVQEAFKLGS
jgi:hypothetical protein